MRAKRLGGLALIGAWWVSINLAWVQVGNEELTGGELSPVLNLLPAIAAVSVFISMYQKPGVILGLVASSLSFIGAWLSVSTQWQNSAEVVEILEQISGIMNADQHASGVRVLVSIVPAISAGIAFASGIFLARASFGKRSSSSKTEIDEAASTNDPRTLWDEQG